MVSAFERETGIPALVNTSFNVHEGPIVNTECAKVLTDGRIDFIVTQRAIYQASALRTNGEAGSQSGGLVERGLAAEAASCKPKRNPK